jgi:CubicO group peptidase (beta-lactamase class C family)
VNDQQSPQVPRALPEEVGICAKRLTRITDVLDGDVRAGRIPGAVIAVARRGKLVLLRACGYRDREAGSAMAEDTLFWAASMTKPMTVAGALMLFEEGKLLLDDPLSRHLPAFSGVRVADLTGQARHGAALPTVEARHEPTIRDLMQHTCGIVEGLLGSTPVHRLYADAVGDGMTSFTADEFIGRLSQVPLLHQPGEVWHYGWGIDLLGLIIESITGQPLHAYLRDCLFDPLGMRETSFGLPEEKTRRYSRPLPDDPFTGTPQTLPDLSLARFASGGAGAVTTAGDYLRFALMLLGGGQLGGSCLLGRKTVELMMSDQLLPGVDDHRIGLQEPTLAGYGFGLGLAVRRRLGGSPAAGSPGDVTWPGASGANWWADPREDLAVVFMAHTPARAARRHYRQLIKALVFQAID